MKNLLLILAAAAATLFTGCATHSPAAIAHVRSSGVSERVVYKLQNYGSLSPGDLIELYEKGVNDGIPLRQLDEVGVNYVVQPDEITDLREAGVKPVVQDALIDASDRFVARRYAPRPRYGYSAVVADPFYYDDPFLYPAPAFGFGVGTVIHSHHHHRCR